MVNTFAELGISEVFIKALKEMKIVTPTDIQVKTIPYLVQTGADFIGQAQTGTGKTAAFGLPILQNINPDKDKIQALILSPTRELGQQIAKQLFKFTKFVPKKIFVECVYGGAPIENQIRALGRPTHIVVATPGRLIDLLERKALNLNHINTIVLDEADEMLSMGFKKELDAVLSQTNGRRATWLFSATMPEEIKSIIAKYMSPKAFRIEATRLNIINKNITHQYVVCKPDDKIKNLVAWIKKQGDDRGIIFCRTKAGAQNLSQQLTEFKIPAEAIHGDLMQKERDRVMRAFKNKKLKILIATDIAARGIDVDNLAYVVHYNLPEKKAYYTHRSGRTARAGKTGVSINFISPNELADLRKISDNLGFSLEQIK